MLDYLPLAITFVLAVIGLLLKTTGDPKADGVRMPLTVAGKVMLILLILSCIVGIRATYDGHRKTEAAANREASRYSRDSTTWAAQLRIASDQRLVQVDALIESRNSAMVQIARLDTLASDIALLADTILIQGHELTSALDAQVRGISGELRVQGNELTAALRAEGAALLEETDRLRNPVTQPTITMSITFPPIEESRNAAASAFERVRGQAGRQEERLALMDAEYGEYSIETRTGPTPYLFPSHFIVTLWRAHDGICRPEDMERRKYSIVLNVSTGRQANWYGLGLSLQGTPMFELKQTQPRLENNGVASLADLRGGCLGVRPNFFPTPEWMDNSRSLLHQVLWKRSTLSQLTVDFGQGREITYVAPDTNGGYPLILRLPCDWPWDPVPTASLLLRTSAWPERLSCDDPPVRYFEDVP